MTSSMRNFYCGGGDVKPNNVVGGANESGLSMNDPPCDADTESVGNRESPQLFDYISAASSEEDNNGNAYRHPITMGMSDLSPPVEPKQQQVFSSAPPPCSNSQQLLASPSPPPMITTCNSGGVASGGEPTQKSASTYHNGHHHHHPDSSATNNVLQQQGSHKLARMLFEGIIYYLIFLINCSPLLGPVIYVLQSELRMYRLLFLSKSLNLFKELKFILMVRNGNLYVPNIVKFLKNTSIVIR